ncbi:hypothetical protein HPB48_010167 [Haemaphysalis longicornis]|uniref:Uncharacterized protein n=1 Tax=Haemaphysalis longicornis TaxID=44386 RepID=A0A9J6FZB7_HAELO|nr:hypothetical protein HPB48_010167 [Haemaphysalis longicornis]
MKWTIAGNDISLPRVHAATISRCRETSTKISTALVPPVEDAENVRGNHEELPAVQRLNLLDAFNADGAWRDVKTDTVANCFRKAGFGTAELAETGEDGDEERIDDAFRELSTLFPAALPPEVSADDFVEVDCNVQAVASLADEDM